MTAIRDQCSGPARSNRDRSPSPCRRRGASLLECLAVVGLTGIVVSTTSVTIARVGALNRAEAATAVASQNRHRFVIQLRRDVHAAHSALLRDGQTLELRQLSDGRESVAYTLEQVHDHTGWMEAVWEATSQEIAIRHADGPNVHFAASIGLSTVDRDNALPAGDPSGRLLPPIESPSQLEEVRQ